jgi:capsule polysaccharide export protein KpsE/RkpR
MLQGAAALEGELVAAESQLQGLRAIYTDSNVRVRSMQSRVAALRNQLNKIGGSAPPNSQSSDPPDSADASAVPSSSDLGAKASSDSMLPSMRNLPLLGVKWADLYRRMQINEAVYETLTQQYELAKVQEAKETPTVKLLDAAEVPQRKSFPPRLLIIAASGALFFCGAALWIVGRAKWDGIEPSDPRKALATEVFVSVNSVMPWATPNGSRLQRMSHNVWTKLTPKNGTPKKDE